MDVLMTNADDKCGWVREFVERSAARDRQLTRRGGIANRHVSRKRLLSKLSAGRRRVNHLRTLQRISVILGGDAERPIGGRDQRKQNPGDGYEKIVAGQGKRVETTPMRVDSASRQATELGSRQSTRSKVWLTSASPAWIVKPEAGVAYFCGRKFLGGLTWTFGS